MLFRPFSMIIILALSSRQLHGLQSNKNLLISRQRRQDSLNRVCGLSKAPVPKILGGENATLNAWPWMAAIFENGQRICGGVLISFNFVLTADHCLRKGKAPEMQPVETFSIRLGDLDLNSEDDGARPEVYNVSNLYAERNYNPLFNNNSDIALMEMTKFVNKSVIKLGTIVPICLPRTPDLIRATYLDKRPYFTGWDNLGHDGKATTILQQMRINVFPVNTCQSIYSRNNTDIVCAGKNDSSKSTCPGDSGGPLMTLRPKKQMAVIGILSEGGNCENTTTPGIFTRVATHIDWILSATKLYEY